MKLARVFLERLAASSRPAPTRVAPADLERQLAAFVDAGQRAWPDLAVDPAAFIAHLADRLDASTEADAALQLVRAPELYLTFACHQGDERAIGHLERTLGAHIEAGYGALPAAELSRDDFRQIVRDKLFVADVEGRTKIGSYSGKGSLAAWLRIAARRIGLNAVRGAKLPVASASEHDDLFEFPASLGDPELDYLKEAYRERFREAFLDAVGALSARDRTLLRQSVSHQLTVRQIGRMYRVHHATAARWLEDARQRLVEETRGALARRLAVSARELDSIMGLIASRLDVSVARVLGPDDE